MEQEYQQKAHVIEMGSVTSQVCFLNAHSLLK